MSQITARYRQPREINGLSLNCQKNASIVTELRSVWKDPRGPMWLACLCHWLSYTKGSLNDNLLLLCLSCHWLTLCLSVASLTLLPSLLHLPYNPSCKSASELLLAGLKIPAPWQWSVTCLCQLPDPFEPSTLAHLCQSHFFHLELCHINLALPKPNMTHVSLSKCPNSVTGALL